MDSANSIPITPVKSSNISGHGYANGTLRIVYTNGGRYDYEGVTPEEFADLELANANPERSYGSTFHKGVRAKYKGRRLGE